MENQIEKEIPAFKNVPINKFAIGELEKKYVNEALDTGWISSEGPFVKKFENALAKLVGRTYGVAVTNGTVALDLAVKALGIGPGDEVIMPSFSIISCAQAVVKLGAIPRFTDVDDKTWNMDVSQIEKLITKKTVAIMVVHTYGLTVPMDEVLAIAKKYNLKIIEDAAEAHGQSYKGRPCGSFGDVSIFSFYPNKNITTGEGGMVLCDDQKIFDRLASLRNLGFIPERRFVHFEEGTNARLSNILAGIGLAQLMRLDETVARKKMMGNNYQMLLAGLPDVTLPLTETSFCKNNYWVFGIVFGPSWPDLPEIEERLLKDGVGNRPFFFGLHEQPLYQNEAFFKTQRLPVTERISRRGLYIPSGVATTLEDQEYVARILEKIARECV